MQNPPSGVGALGPATLPGDVERRLRPVPNVATPVLQLQTGIASLGVLA